jgi:hypothetical protein
MATARLPEMGSRVNVQLFASDLLAYAGLVHVEAYPEIQYVSATLSDGKGVKVALTGDRSSLRMILSAALVQLDPDANPEPHAEPDGES